MWRSLQDRLGSRGGVRVLVAAVLLLDVIVTAAAWLTVPHPLYATGRFFGGIFVLFPIVLVFAVGVPTAVIMAIRDWREEQRLERPATRPHA